MAANLDALTLQNDPPVPAHRVVNRLGQLTGRHHFPTPTAMQERLEAEGVRVEDDVVVDFKKLFWNPATELE
jgi:methylated-DNA-protein-cysteine methyltransferase-like protein